MFQYQISSHLWLNAQTFFLADKPSESIYPLKQEIVRQTNNKLLETPTEENFAMLMAKTVNLISKLREETISSIKSLSSKIEKLINEIVLSLPTHPSSRNNAVDLKAKTHVPQKLVLQKNQLCITVLPFKGHYISWRTRGDISRHLSFLL